MSTPFFHTLRELRAGMTLEDLSGEMAKVVQAVRETGKKGSLTLTLTVKPPRKGGAVYLTVEDEITAKVPTLDHSDTVFFFGPNGALTRSDPSQQDLPLRSINVDQSTG